MRVDEIKASRKKNNEMRCIIEDLLLAVLFSNGNQWETHMKILEGNYNPLDILESGHEDENDDIEDENSFHDTR